MADDLSIKGAAIDAAMSVQAPGSEDSIVDAHILEEISVEDGVVTAKLQFPKDTSKSARWDVEDALTDALEGMDGVKEALVKSFVEGWEEQVAQAAEAAGAPSGGAGASARSPQSRPSTSALNDVGRIIAVGSGKGGVGKSTVAVNLALALQDAGYRVGILDIDIYGPSLPTLLGINERPSVRGQQIVPLEAHGLKLMSLGFLMDDETPVIWRGPILAGIIRQFLQDVDWSGLDYLVVDLPPGTGDAQLSFIQTTESIRGTGPDGAVIVTTPSDLALIDASRGLRMFDTLKVKVLGIVENMAYFAWPGTADLEKVADELRGSGQKSAAKKIDKILKEHGRSYIFGKEGGQDEAKKLKLPMLGEIPLDPEVRAGGDRGEPAMISAPTSQAADAFRELAQSVIEATPVESGAPKKKGVLSSLLGRS